MDFLMLTYILGFFYDPPCPHLLPLGLRLVPLHQLGDLGLQLPASKIVEIERHKPF